MKRLRLARIKLRPAGVPRLRINDKEIKKMYVTERLSSWKIADIAGCGRSSIHRRLKRLNLARDISTAHVKYHRTPFSEDPIERAYLLGFAIGDLRVRKVGKKSKTVKVDCGSTKQEQIDLIYDLFSKYGRVWVSKPNNSGKVQIEAFLDESFDFLINCRQKLDLEFKKELFIPFFAGFTDAEGSIFITNNKAAYSLGNYDNELLEAIKKKLKIYNIAPVYIYKAKKRYTITGGYKQRYCYWHLKISRKELLLKLFNMLDPYLKHSKRKGDIEKALANLSRRNLKNKVN
ncbi:MAG: LAGLIDADG family homing endonuclease [Candidatus Micrarchaeota archaeon]